MCRITPSTEARAPLERARRLVGLVSLSDSALGVSVATPVDVRVACCLTVRPSRLIRPVTLRSVTLPLLLGSREVTLLTELLLLLLHLLLLSHLLDQRSDLSLTLNQDVQFIVDTLTHHVLNSRSLLGHCHHCTVHNFVSCVQNDLLLRVVLRRRGSSQSFCQNYGAGDQHFEELVLPPIGRCHVVHVRTQRVHLRFVLQHLDHVTVNDLRMVVTERDVVGSALNVELWIRCGRGELERLTLIGLLKEGRLEHRLNS
ncbi:hypothetical protein D3C80_1122660 [compost metagenome]